MPAPPALDVEQGDKLQHLAAYGLLMLWFSLLYKKFPVRILYAMTFITLGIVLEYVQRWLGYRTFDYADMAANAAGVLLGWAAAVIAARILPLPRFMAGN